MKLQSLKIANVLGAQSVDISTGKNVLMIAGANGAGKSSIAEAIRQTLTGEAVRVGLKKDFPALVHQGADKGVVELEFDSMNAVMVLPGGDRKGNGQIPPGFEYCLDPQRFAVIEPKERRALIFSLMGVKVTAAEVRKRYIANNFTANELVPGKEDLARIDAVLPLLAAGFETAQKEAQAKARDAKASWRAVTGETWGCNKAEGWRAPQTAAPTADVTAMTASLAELDAKLEAETKTLGELTGAQKTAKANASSWAATRESAGSVDRLEKKLKVDEAQLADWNAKVAELQRAADVGTICDCPHCGGTLEISDKTASGKLEVFVYEGEKATDAGGEKLQDAIAARDLMQRSVNNDNRDLAKAFAAVEALKGAPAVDAPDDAAVEAQTEKVNALKDERRTFASQIGTAIAAEAAHKQASAATVKAAGFHADVMAWDGIADALSPAGIPAEFLKDAIVPFNVALAKEAHASGWPQAQVDDDMNITVGDRAYALRSESEKWRADAMIAVTIAAVSGAKFIMLDRFDVLDSAGRSDALYWLDELAEPGIGAVVFGTLKAIPAGLPANIDGRFITGGILNELEQAA